MPAIITHHIFGEDASNLLPEGLLTCEEDLLAFLLGNQGPDPFWARIRTLPRRAKTCHVLANAMHSSHIVDTFLVLRDCAAHVRDDDKTITKKVMRAVTDNGPQQPNSPRPEVIENLFTFLKIASSQDTYDYFNEKWNDCTLRYGDMKKQIAKDL